MRTRKTIKVSGTEFSAVGASLAGHVRIDKNNSFTFSFSFVFNELLQLVEAPRIEPSVQSFSHEFVSAFPDSFQFFQYNTVCTVHDFLTYFVVNPSHVAFLPAGNFLQKSLGRFCAFGLKFFPQELELLDFGFVSCKNFAVRSDSKVVYSDINPHYLVTTRSRRVDLSGECYMKEQFSFPIPDNLKRLITPVKIFPVVFRDFNRNIKPLPLDKGCDPYFIKGKCEKFSVERDSRFLHNWSFFSGFKIFRSLADCFNNKVSRQPLSQVFVDKMMELKAVSYFGFKAFINRILNCFSKSTGHFINLFAKPDFQFYGGNEFHSDCVDILLYKPYAHPLDIVSSAIFNKI